MQRFALGAMLGLLGWWILRGPIDRLLLGPRTSLHETDPMAARELPQRAGPIVVAGEPDAPIDATAPTSLEWVRNPGEVEVLRAIAAEAPPLDQLTKSSPSWASTGVALLDFSRAQTIDDGCRAELELRDDRVCTFAIDIVVVGEEISYARAESDTEPLADECLALASCHARERLGVPVPVPEEQARAALAIEILVAAKPPSDQFRDPNFLDEFLLMLEADLATARTDMDAEHTQDGELAFRYLLQQNLVAHLRAQAARLREEQHGR